MLLSNLQTILHPTGRVVSTAGILTSILLPVIAQAQSITTAPDGTGTIIHHQGNIYHIGGGTQGGANLFHSFQELGLSPA